MKVKKVADRPLTIISIILISFGFLIFLSASLGLAARQDITYSSIVLNQFILGILGGGIACFIISNIHYSVWKKYSLFIFIIAWILTALVFVPNIGFSHGGATRWLHIGPLSFQPAEMLKIATVMFIATWLSNSKKYMGDIKRSLIPFVVILGLVGIILYLQPDIDTFVVLTTACTSMYFIAGGKLKHFMYLAIAAILLLGIIALTRPYVASRIINFINPSQNSLTNNYQLHQSLIAIGSGGLSGRGIGQSIQKFSFLPEPIGDSIFAVFAEETGFIGTSLLIIIFVLFALRGLKIASRAPDSFAMLLGTGIIIMIITQAFMNISAMLGIIPLSGLPLTFISHGGTSLFFAMVSVGILLNISRYSGK